MRGPWSTGGLLLQIKISDVKQTKPFLVVVGVYKSDDEDINTSMTTHHSADIKTVSCSRKKCSLFLLIKSAVFKRPLNCIYLV